MSLFILMPQHTLSKISLFQHLMKLLYRNYCKLLYKDHLKYNALDYLKRKI